MSKRAGEKTDIKFERSKEDRLKQMEARFNDKLTQHGQAIDKLI